MIRFDRFTTDYDPVEDRMRLAGEAANGDCATLWINLRMLRLLVPALCQWIERQPVSHAATKAPEVQQFHQAAADFARDHAIAPVPPLQSTSLVTSVDYTDLGQAIRLTFKSLDGSALAVLDFTESALRQWLSIVRDVHLAADWPTGALPVWLRGAMDTTARLH
jgi:hypothetical protein